MYCRLHCLAEVKFSKLSLSYLALMDTGNIQNSFFPLIKV